jgi:hypothetical protein
MGPGCREDLLDEHGVVILDVFFLEVRLKREAPLVGPDFGRALEAGRNDEVDRGLNV